MSLSVKLDVDASRVDAAKAKIDAFKESLAAMRDGGGGDLGSDSLLESNELIRQISENITRMKSLVLSGENKGGLLNTRQWEELGTVSERINDNLSAWADNINEARTALWKLIQEKERLQAVSVTNPEEWQAAQERLGELEPQEKELRKRYDALNARQARVDFLEGKASEWVARSDMLGHEQPKQDTAGGGIAFGKIMAMMAAMTGGFSVLSFLAQSREMYRHYSIESAGLAARGIGAPGPIELYGYNESVGYIRSYAESTGYRGDRARAGTAHALHWSRAADMDPGFAIDQAGQYRNLFGDGDREYPKRVLNSLLYIGDQTRETPARINRVLSAGFGMISSRQGGAEIDKAQTAEMGSLTTQLINKLGTMGKDPSTMNRLQGAMETTGNKYFDLLISKKLGYLDGDMTPDKIMQGNDLRLKGWTTKEGMTLAKEMLNEMDPSMRPLFMSATFGKNQLLSGSLDQVQNFIMKGYQGGDITEREILDHLEDGGGAVQGSVERKHAAWQGKTGVLSRKITSESARMGMGEQIEKAFGEFEAEALKNLNKFVRSEFVNSVAEGFKEAFDYLSHKGGDAQQVPTEKQVEVSQKAFDTDGFFGLWKEHLKSWLPSDQDKETMRNFTHALLRFIGAIERNGVPSR